MRAWVDRCRPSFGADEAPPAIEAVHRIVADSETTEELEGTEELFGWFAILHDLEERLRRSLSARRRSSSV